MTRRALLLGLAAVALVGTAAAAALRPPAALEGRVIDARSGRVASGATVVYDGRVLRRFHSPDFRFEGGAGANALIEASAPGYEPASAPVAADGAELVLALTPRAIPDLGGVLVSPKLSGTRLELPARLLDQRGRVKDEFPAVELQARLIIASKEGTPLGFLDLDPRIDFSQPALSLSLSADLPEIERAGGPEGAVFLVSIKAGETVVASRPFLRPDRGAAEGGGP